MTGPDAADRRPKVFISYSHDSAEHRERVLELSDRLRDGGVAAYLDRYEDSPPEGWPRWLQRQLGEADYVLVVCTEPYARHYLGREGEAAGLETAWAGAILTQELYEAAARTSKLIPVVFSDADEAHIPIELRAFSRYSGHTEQGYDKLYRRLTHQPDIRKPQLGKVRAMPPRKRQGPKSLEDTPATGARPDLRRRTSPADERAAPASSRQTEDFVIRFGLPQGRAYPTRVDSASGQDEGIFEIPFAEGDLSTLMANLGPRVRGDAATLPGRRHARPPAPARPWHAASTDSVATGGVLRDLTLEQTGGKLFHALFHDRVAELYRANLEGALRQGHRLRIRLHFGSRHPHLHRLTNLPWEVLYDDRRQSFISQLRSSPLVRYLELPQPVPAAGLRPPLHILVAAFAPEDRPLGLVEEAAAIQAAWSRHPGVSVSLLERPTAHALREQLLKRPTQILHFMGHGDFDPRTGEGALVLASPTDSSATVPGSTLARQLRETGLQLVVLNACDSARVSDRRGHDPFTGVATALVAGGLGAVVAMQFPISDPAAGVFSDTFYRRLAACDQIDEAVTEGRLAIDGEEPGTLEWSTPVLYLRS